MFFLLLLALIVILLVFSKAKTKKKPAPDLSFLPDKFIVFDLETTGLSPYDNEIIEIGAIKVNRHSIHHDAYQQLIKPIHNIPARITQINGITQAMADQDGKVISEALPEFIAFIEDYRLVAFNADFDMGFIKEAAKAQGYRITNKHSCALKMARKAWPGLDSYKLENLAKMAGLSIAGNHRALKDCELATTVYMSAAAKLKSIS